jgi:hypothetical protein
VLVRRSRDSDDDWEIDHSTHQEIVRCGTQFTTIDLHSLLTALLLCVFEALEFQCVRVWQSWKTRSFTKRGNDQKRSQRKKVLMGAGCSGGGGGGG